MSSFSNRRKLLPKRNNKVYRRQVVFFCNVWNVLWRAADELSFLSFWYYWSTQCSVLPLLYRKYGHRSIPSNIQTRLKCTYISYDKDKYFDVQFSVELFIKNVVFWSSFKRNIIQPEFFLLRRIMISSRSG